MRLPQDPVIFLLLLMCFVVWWAISIPSFVCFLHQFHIEPLRPSFHEDKGMRRKRWNERWPVGCIYIYIYINRMNDLHYVPFPKGLAVSVASREWASWLAIYAQKIHIPMILVRKSLR